MDETAPAAVVNVQPAGNFVTRGEFVATVKPMSDDLREIKADVKTLLAARAGRQALSRAAKTFGTGATALGAGVVGALFSHFIH